MNINKMYKIIIVLLILILWMLWYRIMKWYPDYQIAIDYEDQISLQGIELRNHSDIISWSNLVMKNWFQYVMNLDVEEILNNQLQFDVVTGGIAIDLDLLRNGKIIHSLGSEIIRTTEDGVAYPRINTCLIIGMKDLEWCAFIQPDSYIWKENMKFQNYQSWDKILIRIKEFLVQGDSIFNWSILNN